MLITEPWPVREWGLVITNDWNGINHISKAKFRQTMSK
jgi:hypothetical protein